jgi:hypothetical protein
MKPPFQVFWSLKLQNGRMGWRDLYWDTGHRWVRQTPRADDIYDHAAIRLTVNGRLLGIVRIVMATSASPMKLGGSERVGIFAPTLLESKNRGGDKD